MRYRNYQAPKGYTTPLANRLGGLDNDLQALIAELADAERRLKDDHPAPFSNYLAQAILALTTSATAVDEPANHVSESVSVGRAKSRVSERQPATGGADVIYSTPR